MSAGFPESLKDMSEIREVPASDRLLNPSAVTDTLEERVPAMNLPAKKQKLVIIPMIPENFPQASFTFSGLF